MQIFTDWKCSVRKKARNLKQQPTGEGSSDKPLTDIENKILDLTGRVVISGIPSVPELGLIVEPVGLGIENIPVIAGTSEGKCW